MKPRSGSTAVILRRQAPSLLKYGSPFPGDWIQRMSMRCSIFLIPMRRLIAGGREKGFRRRRNGRKRRGGPTDGNGPGAMTFQKVLRTLWVPALNGLRRPAVFQKMFLLTESTIWEGMSWNGPPPGISLI